MAEDRAPEGNEEENDKQGDLPLRYLRARPEKCPVAAVGRRKPKVLQNHGDEKPPDSVSPTDCAVECRDLLGKLAVVVWKPVRKNQTDCPQTSRDRDDDRGEERAWTRVLDNPSMIRGVSREPQYQSATTYICCGLESYTPGKVVIALCLWRPLLY